VANASDRGVRKSQTSQQEEEGRDDRVDSIEFIEVLEEFLLPSARNGIALPCLAAQRRLTAVFYCAFGAKSGRQ
jgi:hypothetical protein